MLIQVVEYLTFFAFFGLKNQESYKNPKQVCELLSPATIWINFTLIFKN